MSTTAYTGRATNWPSVIVSGLLLVPLIGLAASSGSVPETVVAFTVIALVGLLGEVVTASDVRASCGPHGVSIHWGVLGWPRAKYPLAAIANASVARSVVGRELRLLVDPRTDRLHRADGPGPAPPAGQRPHGHRHGSRPAHGVGCPPHRRHRLPRSRY